MNLFKDLQDEAAAWESIGGRPSKDEMEVRSMSLIEFLELLSTADFKFRYEPGNPKTRGIQVRHEILQSWIGRLKAAERVVFSSLPIGEKKDEN